MKKSISFTGVFQKLVESAETAIDQRHMLVKAGYIENDTEFEMVFGIVFCQLVLSSFEKSDFIGSVVLDISEQICSPEVAGAIKLLVYEMPDFSGTYDAERGLVSGLFDIKAFAAQGARLGWKKHWGKFLNADLLEQWNSQFY